MTDRCQSSPEEYLCSGGITVAMKHVRLFHACVACINYVTLTCSFCITIMNNRLCTLSAMETVEIALNYNTSTTPVWLQSAGNWNVTAQTVTDRNSTCCLILPSDVEQSLGSKIHWHVHMKPIWFSVCALPNSFEKGSIPIGGVLNSFSSALERLVRLCSISHH